jgi:acetyltransferase-like isoleucine patch superfamily enzyme
VIQASSPITIKENVHLSFASKLITAGLDLNDSSRKKHISNPIIVEKNVWIGANATVLRGVTLGEYSAIAAGAVVTKNVEPYTLVAGILAKKIRSLNNE